VEQRVAGGLDLPDTVHGIHAGLAARGAEIGDDQAGAPPENG
jgi:hypothetical protein